VAQRFGEAFPLGTLIVNISGCFLIGVLAACNDPGGRIFVGPAARQFLMIGVMGGYTTFSSFSLQTLTLLQDGEWLYAAANVLFSVILCMVGVWLGYVAGEALNAAR
jgi:CrcB protein